MDDEERAVLQAVEDYAWDRHSTLTSSDVEQWNLDEEEYARLEWDEQGYLIVSVEDVHVEETQMEDGVKVWYVSATINAGLDSGDPDVYSCYMGEDGKYAIEWHHS